MFEQELIDPSSYGGYPDDAVGKFITPTSYQY
jgi:hypothetical protein